MSASAYKGWETRREREERVTVNLPPDLLPLWQRVRYQFSGTPDERREAFLAYVEEHEGEVIDAIQREADAAVAKMIRAWEREEEQTQ